MTKLWQVPDRFQSRIMEHAKGVLVKDGYPINL